MDHGKQRSELYQSISAAQHSPLAYVSPSDRPTSSCKVMHESSYCIELPDLTGAKGRTKEVFRLQKTRTEKARSEFTFRNCRLVNRLEKNVEFSRPYGLKKRLIILMWEFVNKRFYDKNVCTWQTFCDCHACRKNWTLF